MTNWFKRIAFEKDHIHKPLEFWRTVIFSDEGIFCIFGIKGCKLVWRKPFTALQKEHLVPTVKHGGGEGSHGVECMASNGVYKLECIESIMNKYCYLDVLKNNLKECATKLGLGSSFRFQHDNDPKHTAEIVKLWLLYNVPNQLHLAPQSSDLNPT
ncbi:transposable element Tcb2 transposase [Trichonephila clavipes]|nr:transposable element Tcb2 transposase [Trichonephila clavipes]